MATTTKAKLFKLLLLVFVVFNIGLGSFGLAETSEARYAEISKEMLTSGDFLHPTLLGVRHLHKPPITYYITSLGYTIFGINEYGARFFLGIALMLQIYLVFKISFLMVKDWKMAYASALIYSSFPVVLIAARNLTTDAYLVTFILWSIYLWLSYNQQKKTHLLYAFFAVLGLAFLTKGPVGLIPPFFFIGCWKYFHKEKTPFSMHILLGALLMLAISASWFITIIMDDPRVWDYLVHDQIMNRATHASQFHRSKPFWYYLALAPVLGLPWLFFIPSYLLKRFKIEWKHSIITKIILTITMGLLMLFSLFSSKLILYILPIFPFISILGSELLFRFSKKNLNWFIGTYHVLFSALILLLLGSIFYAEIRVNLLHTALLLILTIGCFIYFLKFDKSGKRSKLLHMGVGFTIVLLLWHTTFAANNPNSINSFKSTAEVIQQIKGDKLENLIIYDDLLPSAGFYMNNNVITVHDNNYRTIRETQFEKDSTFKQNLINLQDTTGLRQFKELLKGSHQVYIEHKKSPINDSLSYLLETFAHKIEKDSWVIYY